MTTLVSFLGKGKDNKTTGYRTARYDFGNGVVREAPYFGLTLTAELTPQRLLLIGTAGSMWDVFFEQQGELDDTLIDAVAEQRVDADLLAAHEQRLAAKLGRPVQCLLIPFACTPAEQIAVLGQLAGAVRADERIVLDVTHAFRHLPMLALVAARYLTHVAGVRIEGIYYGALEMTKDGLTPVLRLDGMLQMLDWVEALATYAKDGDYGVFAPLLVADGMNESQGDQLARAAFFERSSNPVKAREAINSVFPAIEGHRGALAELFKGELEKRIAWFRGKSRHDWELALADAYLERRDYVRAAIFLYEAFVTRATQERNGDINDYSQRETAWQAAREDNKRARKLEYLRNALTHGVKPTDKDTASIVASEQHLEQALQEFRSKLFP